VPEDGEDTQTYNVVVNHEEQYSIWLADRQIPEGWRAEGFPELNLSALITSTRSGRTCGRSACVRRSAERGRVPTSLTLAVITASWLSRAPVGQVAELTGPPMQILIRCPACPSPTVRRRTPGRWLPSSTMAATSGSRATQAATRSARFAVAAATTGRYLSHGWRCRPP